MEVWNVLHVARWKDRTEKFAVCAPSHNFVGLYLRHWGMYRQSEKNLLNSNISSTCPHNKTNFGSLTVEIGWRLLNTTANLNGFCVLDSLLHQRRSTEVNQLDFRDLINSIQQRAPTMMARRPSRWASAHILVDKCCSKTSIDRQLQENWGTHPQYITLGFT